MKTIVISIAILTQTFAFAQNSSDKKNNWLAMVQNFPTISPCNSEMSPDKDTLFISNCEDLKRPEKTNTVLEPRKQRVIKKERPVKPLNIETLRQRNIFHVMHRPVKTSLITV